MFQVILRNRFVEAAAFAAALTLGMPVYAQEVDGAEEAAAQEAAQVDTKEAVDETNPARKRRSGGGTTSTIVDEVIVAGAKRNIEAAEMPVAISTLSEETLDYGGVNNTGVTAFYMPSLGIFNEPTWSFISVRGMGAGLNGGFEQSVGIIYDGINLGRSAFMNDPLIDTQQLEVLRGPQGTVTGKNAVAGAYVVTSGKPHFEWGGKYDVSLRDFVKDRDGYDAQGVITGPIIEDVLAFRVAYSVADVEGDLWNETLQRNEANEDTWAGRASLLLVLGDDIEINLSHKRSNVSENGPNHDIAYFGGSYQAVMSPYGTVEDDQYNRRTARDYPGMVDRDSNMTSLNVDVPFGDYKTKFILGHASQDNFVALDADWGPAPVIVTETDIDYEQISAEFNISQDFAAGGLDVGLPGWIAGLFYYESEYRSFNSTPLLPNGGIGLTGQDLCGLFDCPNELNPLLPITEVGRQDNFTYYDQFTRSMAAFFELSLPTYIIPRTLFTVGARITKEHKEVDFERSLPPDQNLNIWPLLIPDTSAFAATDEIDETAWTGRFSLQYFPPGDNMNLFFTASRGWKAGGFNTASGIPEELEFKPETSWNVEVGAKWRFWDETAGINFTLYYGEFSDLQTETYNGEKFVVGNAASARTQGVEFEIGIEEVFGVYGLEFGTQFSTVDVKFLDYPNGPCMAGVDGSCDQSGKPKGGHTPFSGATSLSYSTPLFNWGVDLAANTSVVYSTESTGQDDQDPRVKTNAYWAAQFRVGVKDPEDLWHVYVGCSNCNGTKASGGFDVPVFTDTIAHVAAANGRGVWTVRAYGRF